jgi:glycosyltransferase involved in cell wall biosynthesis
MTPGDHPLVSCITGTWQRHELLKGAIENIEAQTYPNIEHIVVSDGPDPELAALMDYWQHPTKRVHLTFAECGRHWSSFLAASTSTVPFQVAQWMARGDYLMWWADDERALVPDHTEALVDLLEETDADFVYPYVRLTSGPGVPMEPHIIGSDPPALGQITHALFRAELLDYCGFTPHVGSATDWYQIERWMQAGARWAMLPRVTFEHRLDKIGEGSTFRAERQPLRGHRGRVAP